MRPGGVLPIIRPLSLSRATDSHQVVQSARQHPGDSAFKRAPGALLSSALAAVAVSALVAGVQAADAPATPEEARQKLEAKKGELEQTRERQKFLKSEVSDLTKEREKLNANLIDTAAQIQASESRLTGLEEKLSGLEKQETAARADLAQNHDKIAKLMAALQRMGRNPPPVLFTQRQDALQMVRSAMLLAHAFPELRVDAAGLAAKLNVLINVIDSIKTEREAARTEMSRLADARVRLSALVETKKQAVVDKQSELDTLKGTAAQLAKNLTDLNELISKLDQAVTKGTGLGAYNAEVAAAPPKSETVQPAAPGRNAEVALNVPPPALKPPIVELRPASLSSSGGRLDRLKPEVPFSVAKARLPLPAQGRRAIAFGDKTQYGGQSKGIVLETRASAQVTSPCDGWVVYAGEFRAYGQLLIINAGEGYHVLLAGLSQLDVQPGQFVFAAEPVGTMSGAFAGSQANGAAAKTQTNSPVLYVEFRKDGRPIDPEPWWAEGQKKVQG